MLGKHNVPAGHAHAPRATSLPVMCMLDMRYGRAGNAHAQCVIAGACTLAAPWRSVWRSSMMSASIRAASLNTSSFVCGVKVTTPRRRLSSAAGLRPSITGYGRAKHEITTELLKAKYPDYNVTWANEGY
ncbi:uncharacterized protein LOC125481141 isoform X1 [Rhincodon typus]|uniref:uncharacterized protein LOC109912013 isoform X1 n=1 Tax=Rhincodon typus TaxID=259920 RepID=UPI00202E1ED0|nr:uncharacterized protein LOC109912013 isoform X1 [Rhincodon typus]XP_048448270.1 uncharacterized protein LOC125481141 isoform X1 [Rhincodon typus]